MAHYDAYFITAKSMLFIKAYRIHNWDFATIVVDNEITGLLEGINLFTAKTAEVCRIVRLKLFRKKDMYLPVCGITITLYTGYLNKTEGTAMLPAVKLGCCTNDISQIPPYTVMSTSP